MTFVTVTACLLMSMIAGACASTGDVPCGAVTVVCLLLAGWLVMEES